MAARRRDANSKRVTTSKRGHTKGKMRDPAFERICELAKALQSVYKQSYELQRPIVADMCANADNVSEDELAHCFDRVLDISCTDYGMKLFNKLCRAFKARYPVCDGVYKKPKGDLWGRLRSGYSSRCADLV